MDNTISVLYDVFMTANSISDDFLRTQALLLVCADDILLNTYVTNNVVCDSYKKLLVVFELATLYGCLDESLFARIQQLLC